MRRPEGYRAGLRSCRTSHRRWLTSAPGVFRCRDRDMDMVARILDKLRQSPFSVEELAFNLKRKPFEIRAAIARLIAAGAIVKLDTDRESGPFYAPAGYVETADRLDNSDLV